jgi:hypothetical protein
MDGTGLRTVHFRICSICCCRSKTVSSMRKVFGRVPVARGPRQAIRRKCEQFGQKVYEGIKVFELLNLAEAGLRCVVARLYFIIIKVRLGSD